MSEETDNDDATTKGSDESLREIRVTLNFPVSYVIVPLVVEHGYVPATYSGYAIAEGEIGDLNSGGILRKTYVAMPEKKWWQKLLGLTFRPRRELLAVWTCKNGAICMRIYGREELAAELQKLSIAICKKLGRDVHLELMYCTKPPTEVFSDDHGGDF